MTKEDFNIFISEVFIALIKSFLMLLFVVSMIHICSFFLDSIEENMTDNEHNTYDLTPDLINAEIKLKESDILLGFALDDIKSLEAQLNDINTELDKCNKDYKYESDKIKPIPLQIAINIHEESSYLRHEWDCSDMANEWVRRSRQQSYTDANYTVGMVKRSDGSYGVHAWGCYTQCIELTSPRFIEGVEIGNKYIPQPWRSLLECEVC